MLLWQSYTTNTTDNTNTTHTANTINTTTNTINNANTAAPLKTVLLCSTVVVKYQQFQFRLLDTN